MFENTVIPGQGTYEMGNGQHAQLYVSILFFSSHYPDFAFKDIFMCAQSLQ